MPSSTPSTHRSDSVTGRQFPASEHQGNPSQRYGQRAATAIARFAQPFLYPSRPPSAQGRREDIHYAHDGTLSSIGVSKDGSQGSLSIDAVFSGTQETEKPIAAIDASPDGTHVVLAGRDILRTAGVSPEGALIEGANILNRVSPKHRDQTAIVDVRWARDHGHLIATAAGSGRVILYDLNRPSFECLTFYEHVRQVHKLAFNPHGGTVFLSGSHDGGIKLWDIREGRDPRRSRATFQGPNQSVRDVKWSSTDAFEFAAGTDSGVVQRWDMRKARAPLLQLNAHDQTCHSIDYHPCSKHLVTAGMDKKVKVWDTTRTDRRQNACWQIQAPQSVFNVCWRPNSTVIRSDDETENRTIPTSQIATSYDSKDLRLHIWDFGRPSIPYQELDHFDVPTTSILWHSNHILWSAGGSSNRGTFSQTDMKNAKKPVDRLNVNVLAVTPDCGMMYYSDQRLAEPFEIPPIQGETLQRTNTEGSNSEYLSSSLSANDGSLDETGLYHSTLSQRRKKIAASQVLVGHLRPNESSMNNEQIGSSIYPPLNLDGSFETSQVGAFGHLRDTFDTGSFVLLANNYCEPPENMARLGLGEAAVRIDQAFVRNSSIAVQAGDDSLAHTWRVLAWAIKRELEDWVKLLVLEKGNFRAESAQNSLMFDSANAPVSIPENASISQVLKTLPWQPSAGAPADCASGPLTPTAQPRTEESLIPDLLSGHPGVLFLKSDRDRESASKNPDVLALPDGKSEHNSMNNDLEERLLARRAALSNYRMVPRSVLRLEDVAGNNYCHGRPRSSVNSKYIGQPSFQHSDSGESFDLLSEGTDSHDRAFAVGSLGESLQSGCQSFESNKLEIAGNDIDELQISSHAEKSQAKRVLWLNDINKDTDDKMLKAFNDDLSRSKEHGSGSTEENLTKKGSARKQLALTLAPIVNFEDMDLTCKANRDPDDVNRPCSKSSANFHPKLKDSVHKSDMLLPSIDPKPWHASSFLSTLLEHHLDRLSSTQLPVFLVIYLHPFYPLLFPTTQGTERSQVKFTLLTKTRPIMTRSRLVAIILTYHAQIMSLRLFTAAAGLRKVCGQLIDEIRHKTQPGIASRWWCRVCDKTSKGRARGRCVRCSKRWAGCSVCGRIGKASQRLASEQLKKASYNEFLKEHGKSKISESGFENSIRRWFYCQGCGHGGHASCVVSWLRQPESEGTCPVPGCRHACGPGPRRDEVRAEIARRKAEATQLRRGNGVVRDDRLARESRAVKAVKPGVLEMEISDLWSDNHKRLAAGVDNGGLNENFGNTVTADVSVATGKGRWRSDRRSGRGSVGNGSGVFQINESDDSTVTLQKQHGSHQRFLQHRQDWREPRNISEFGSIPGSAQKNVSQPMGDLQSRQLRVNESRDSHVPAKAHSSSLDENQTALSLLE